MRDGRSDTSLLYGAAADLHRDEKISNVWSQKWRLCVAHLRRNCRVAARWRRRRIRLINRMEMWERAHDSGDYRFKEKK